MAMFSLIRLLVGTRWARYGTAAILLACAGIAVAGAFASPPGNRASNFAAAAVFVVLALAAAAAGMFLPTPARPRKQTDSRAGGYGASVVGTRDRSREQNPR